MKNVFKNIKIKKLTNLETNKINGKTAERYINSLLTTALEARVFWASRTEDDSQVDLITVLTHPWLVNRVEVLFTQVKSGKTYCTVENGKLNIDKTQFESLLNRNHHILLCWTRVDQSIPYWFIIRANAKYIRTEYNESHILSPATKFDIVRILTTTINKDGGRGLSFSRENSRSEYDNKDFKTLRLEAKATYKTLSANSVISPLFGEIEFTRLGWRHITRESRLNIFKVATFEILQILPHILIKTPSKHHILTTEIKKKDGFCFRENEYILQYSQIKCYDRELKKSVNVNVFIKILELILHKEQWKDTPNSSFEVERRIIFKSVYFKEKK